MTLLLLFAFLLGMRHALEADHVAAVATLATRVRSAREAAKVGGLWGLGHAGTIVLFGAILIALGASVPPGIAHALEVGVGVVLVLLGLDVLRRIRTRRLHVHAHEHDGGVRHVHVHAHEHSTRHDHAAHGHAHGLGRSALAVGSLHGLAGTAAIVLLSLETIPSRSAALAYLLIFAAGSIAGMSVFSAVVALPLRRGGSVRARAHVGLEALYGLFAVGLGLTIVLG
jgi:ABC-type nickel/cobalt efflux system permease component RcnA